MMKKAHILAMTALALAAGSVAAQSSLQIYGNLDMSLSNTKQSNTAWGSGFTAVPVTAAASNSTTRVTSGVMSDSFIGFKGTEDLGGGMEAQFALETYLDGDTGATSNNQQLLSAVSRLAAGPTASWNTRDEGGFWAKNAYVGLKTNFGLFRLGQMENLGYLSSVKYNPFGSAAINPTTRVFYGTDYYARSWSNAIAYYLRTDGWLLGIQHAPKRDNTALIAGQRGGAKSTATVSYGAGPLNVSLGFESNKDNVSADGEAKSWALHGSYDFGVAKLYAEYGSGKVDSVAGQDVKSTGYQLGASVPVGASGAFLLSYAAGELEADNTVAPLSLAVGTKFRDVKSLAVGYSHSLSKRTSVYAAYLDEEDRYPVAGPANALNNLRLETKQLSIGVRHSF